VGIEADGVEQVAEPEDAAPLGHLRLGGRHQLRPGHRQGERAGAGAEDLATGEIADEGRPAHGVLLDECALSAR